MSDINFRINDLAINYFDGNNSKMAKILSTSEANIRNYRANREPKIEFLTRIAEYLEINYEWLLTGRGTMLKSEISEKNIDYKEKYIEALEKIITLQEELTEVKKEIASEVSGVRAVSMKTGS